MKKILITLGIIIKLIIDLLFGLSIILIVTIIGYIFTFTYKRLEVMYIEISELFE